MSALLAMSEREGFRPYILGATPEVLEKACAVIRSKHPGLRLAGAHHGYFSDDQAPRLVAEIRASEPDLLFVAMSTPRKEQFLHRYRDELGAPFMMGVGGSIDVMAGVVKRAPGWMQRSGLEWLFRVVQEPRRMWRRYLSTNSAFACLMVRAMVARAVRPRTL
jgi:N-acetylglucosaminyldiphosphoundecaprenol N-acetyl-beta-D-mannosaminyltransferase